MKKNATNKSLKAILLASGSSVIFSVTGASADNNEAFLDQSGIGNSALVDQSAAEASNLGYFKATPTGPSGVIDGIAKQVGDDNSLSVTQTGRGHSVATGPGQNGRAEQRGDDNTLTITQTRDVSQTNDFGNEVALVLQEGDHHSAAITQTAENRGNLANLRQSNNGAGEDGNDATITQINTDTGNSRNRVMTSTTDGGVNQSGQRNSATVDQDGMRLQLRHLRQTGDDNSASVTMTGSDNGNAPYGLTVGFSGASGAAGSQVNQIGNRNQAGLTIGGSGNNFGTKQEGDDNLALNIDVVGIDNSVGVGQFGDGNEIDLSSIAGNDNSVGFNQTGNDNFASATVNDDNNSALISQVGNDNETWLSVTGDNNIAVLGMTGNDNYANGQQTGDGNVMTLDFNGNGNNAVGFSSGFTDNALDARNFVRGSTPGDTGFRRGDLFQVGDGNTMTITGSLADNNTFAMFQGGDGNSITGRIENGSFNQAVVAQVGSGNSANFTQSGSNNNLGIMQ